MKNIKEILIATILCITFNGYAFSQTMEWNNYYSTTIFYDDFLNSQIDPNKWNVEDDAYLENTLFIDSSATISVNAGNLQLTTISCPNCSSGGITRNHAAGKVTTKDNFQYGIFESRICFPRKEGTSAYFQLRGGNGVPCSQGGLYENEINIANSWWRGYYPNYHLSHTVRHYHTGTDCLEDYWRVNWFSYENSESTYHTYKCIWTPSYLRYYLDDNLIHEALNTGSSCPDCNQKWFPEYQLHLSFYQILNTDVLLYIEVPQTTYIDYVSVKRFFATPKITCPNAICTQSTATLDVDALATNITWALIPGNYFSGATSGTGKVVTITPSGYNGTGKIKYSFQMPSGETYSAEKTFGVKGPRTEDITLSVYKSDGTPATQAGSTWLMCPNTTYHIYVNNNNTTCTTSNYNWTVPSSWSQFYTWQNMISINTNSSPGGPVSVSATTCCGNNATIISTYLGSAYNCGYYYLSFTPNPSVSETILTIEQVSDEQKFEENEEWELEIYDQSQSLKEKNVKLKGKEYKINTTGWKEGVYIVRVKYKNEVLQEKLVVKK